MDGVKTEALAEEIRRELREIGGALSSIAWSLDQVVKALYQLGNDRERE